VEFGVEFGAWGLRYRASIFAVVAGLCAAPVASFAADLPLVAKAPAQGCVQAVDGINGKVGGFGGAFGSQTYAGGLGSLSMPLGCELGMQIDASAADFDGRFLGSTSAHLFWRDPAKGLVGAYGDFVQWNQFGGVRAGHLGPEGAWYAGRFTAEGVAGVEFGNSQSGTVGATIQTFSVPTRFFDEINLAYYPLDNLEVYAGHRLIGGSNALALGGEWGIPMSRGIMTALFVEGRVGQGEYRGVWGGLRVYFGKSDKSLIRRHREDDPNSWSDGPASVFNNGSTSSGLTCPPHTHPDGHGGCIGI
jgi:hypothetical protein